MGNRHCWLDSVGNSQFYWKNLCNMKRVLIGFSAYPGSESALTSADMCRLACISVVLKLVLTGLTRLTEVDVQFLPAPALTGVMPTLLLAPTGAYGMKNCPP